MPWNICGSDTYVCSIIGALRQEQIRVGGGGGGLGGQARGVRVYYPFRDPHTL